MIAVSLALALLAAIAFCALAPSPNMREMWWIPEWLGEWADRNGNFRNFPVFAAFAALLFIALSLSPLHRRSSEKLKNQTADIRPPTSGFLPLPTADSRLNTAASASTSNQQLATRHGRRRLAFGVFAAAALLGASLEALQLLLPGRHTDPMDILWMTLGAFVGAAVAAAFSLLIPWTD